MSKIYVNKYAAFIWFVLMLLAFVNLFNGFLSGIFIFTTNFDFFNAISVVIIFLSIIVFMIETACEMLGSGK